MFEFEKATIMMERLYEKFRQMIPSEILDALENMHQGYGCGVASWAPIGQNGGYFYEIVYHLYQKVPLTEREISRFVNMLLWSELREYRDRSAPAIFVMMAKQQPQKEYLSVLQAHLEWLQKERLGVCSGTNYYAGISSEIELTEEAINACKINIARRKRIEIDFKKEVMIDGFRVIVHRLGDGVSVEVIGENSDNLVKKIADSFGGKIEIPDHPGASHIRLIKLSLNFDDFLIKLNKV